jgi:hypothetical protein
VKSEVKILFTVSLLFIGGIFFTRLLINLPLFDTLLPFGLFGLLKLVQKKSKSEALINFLYIIFIMSVVWLVFAYILLPWGLSGLVEHF